VKHAKMMIAREKAEWIMGASSAHSCSLLNRPKIVL
jgi:hypothetical protein